MRKTSLIGTGTCTERFSVFWTFAWRAILCYIGLTYISVVTESTLLGPMKFPEMWQQGHYVRWTAMMLVGAFITYVSPIFAARWLLRRKYLRRTTWLDTARLWWAFTWRFWLPVFAVRVLVFKFAPQSPMASLVGHAISLPLAVWLAGGGMRRLILDEISPTYPQIGFNVVCTACGIQMNDGAAFCSHCGTAVAPV